MKKKKSIWKEKKRSLEEEVVFIRKRLGWIIFWLIVIAIGIGRIIPY